MGILVFPRMWHLLILTQVTLPKITGLLCLPHTPHYNHPLQRQMTMGAPLLSSNHSAQEGFQTKLLTLSYNHGDRVQRNSMRHQLPNGYFSAINTKIIIITIKRSYIAHFRTEGALNALNKSVYIQKTVCTSL